MARLTAAAFALCLAAPTAAWARPVSYEGGWTVIEETDRESTALLIHYTPHRRLSLGYLAEWERFDDRLFQGVQATALVHRWFGPDHQANLYLMAAAGVTEGVDDAPEDAGAAGMIGLMADWETRRWFASYRARAMDGADQGATAMQAARVGVAPYIGDTGDLHTWLMLEVDQRPGHDDPIGVTPLLRFFKGSALLEAGWSLTDDQPLLNFTYRF